jgi:CDP-6-deoxy-D-xylo-4-hexulose-3-dehydrase
MTTIKLDTIFFKKGDYKISVNIICDYTSNINISIYNDSNKISNKYNIEYYNWYNEVSTLKTYHMEFSIIFEDKYNIEITNEENNKIKISSYTLTDQSNQNIIFNSDNRLDCLLLNEISKNLSNSNNGFKYPLISNTFNEDEIFALSKFIISGEKLTMGTHVEAFEKQFANYIGSNYAVMVNSGSSANLLAVAVVANYMYKNKLNPNDEVLVPALCWSTTVWPLIQCGLKPVFVDINPQTMNIDENKIEQYIGPNTKALMIVHVMGNCADMDLIMNIVNKHKLLLIEDTCESLGSSYKNKKLGSFGEFGTYSFYYSHHITTIEGGMVITNDYDSYNLLKSLRAHGWTRNLSKEIQDKYKREFSEIDDRYMFINLGYNLRPMELQAVMGEIQLKKLDDKNINRIYNFNKIKDQIMTDHRNKNLINLPISQTDSYIAWFGLCMYINPLYESKLNDFKNYLTSNSVENRPIITGNFVRQPYFILNNYNYKLDDFPNADLLHNCGLYIGLSCEKYSDESIINLVNIIFDFFC